MAPLDLSLPFLQAHYRIIDGFIILRETEFGSASFTVQKDFCHYRVSWRVKLVSEVILDEGLKGELLYSILTPIYWTQAGESWQSANLSINVILALLRHCLFQMQVAIVLSVYISWNHHDVVTLLGLWVRQLAPLKSRLRAAEEPLKSNSEAKIYRGKKGQRSRCRDKPKFRGNLVVDI